MFDPWHSDIGLKNTPYVGKDEKCFAVINVPLFPH